MTEHSAKKRQKARQRKAARRKKKATRKTTASRPQSPRAMFRTSGSWPLYECLVTKSWQEKGEIVQILVSRRSPSGQIAAGTFLVDLGCLGVKNAFGSLLSMMEYRQKLRGRVTGRQKMIEADLDLVAKIIREAVAYARDLGFKPNADYREASIILGDANPDACDAPIPLGGHDGKPLFVAGPYDNAKLIIAKLTRKLGPDGFHYIAPIEIVDGQDLLLDE
jgi:hypothetical protein